MNAIMPVKQELRIAARSLDRMQVEIMEKNEKIEKLEEIVGLTMKIIRIENGGI